MDETDTEMLDVTISDLDLNGFGTFTMLIWEADGLINITFAKQVMSDTYVVAPFPPELKAEEDKQEVARRLAKLGYTLLEFTEHTTPPN